MTSSFFGGAPALSWSIPNPDPTSPQRWLDNEALRGVPLGGRVITVGVPTQQTEMGTGKPKWWQEPNPAAGVAGRPKMNIAVTLRCDGTHGGRDLRNPENPADTGDRILYVPDFGDLNKAIKAAFVKAGADDLLIGGVLLVAWLGYRASKQANAHPARTFAAQYTLPPTSMAVSQSAQQTTAGPMPTVTQPDGRVAPVHTGGLPTQPAQPAASPFPAQTPATGPTQPAANPFGGPSQHVPPNPSGTAPNPFS